MRVLSPMTPRAKGLTSIGSSTSDAPTLVSRASPIVASVIVPVRNAKAELRALISALRQQTTPRHSFEVVVGDDGSTDRSVDGLETTDGWLRVTSGPPQTSYAARNRAVALARAPILAFCDADCRPEPTWLEAGLAALAGADIVAGRIRFALPPRRTIWTLLEMELSKNAELHARLGRAETANLFVRRDLFERLGGFDPTLPSHGDFDFVARCVAGGAKLLFAPDAVVWHATRESPKWLLEKIWLVNWAYAVREGRIGGRPYATRARWWVPVVPTLRARRRFGCSLGLDRRQLAANGVEPTWWDELRALPMLYVLLPYLAGLAQLVGWREGRKNWHRDVDAAPRPSANDVEASGNLSG